MNEFKESAEAHLNRMKDLAAEQTDFEHLIRRASHNAKQIGLDEMLNGCSATNAKGERVDPLSIPDEEPVK